MSKRRDDWSAFMRIIAHVRPYILVFVCAIVCTILFGVTETALPWVLKLMLDADRPGALISTASLPWALPVLVLSLFSLRGLFGFGKTYCQQYLQHSMVMRIRRDMVGKLVALRQEYHDNESSGILIARVVQYAGKMAEFSVAAASGLLLNTARLAGIIATMVVLDWQRTLMVVVVLPLTAAVISWFAKRIRRHASKLAEAEGELTARLGDSLQGQKVVKAFGGEQRERNSLNFILAGLRSTGLRLGAALALNRPAAQVVVGVVIALVLWQLASDLAAGTITEGDMGAFLVALALVPMPLRELAGVSEFYHQALANAGRVFPLIDAQHEDTGGSHAPTAMRGEIVYRDVDFAYAGTGRPALRGLNLRIPAGSSTALVGVSGSGKTTIASLLMRLYRPDSGTISLDGVDLEEYRLDALRGLIGMVTQDILLFDASVAENIAYPARGAEIDRSRLEKALEHASAADLVASMPEGLDTVLGERGLRISGGERQRLSIARAFYKNAPVLVLDEATSALDSVTEQTVKASIERLLEGRTALIIAHRLATVEIADRVVVLDGGKVAAAGTHDELLRSSPIYVRMRETQLLAGDDDMSGSDRDR